ncbi:MAG: DoxX family membrane protein, partial [Muribaculaceae bacterium]|nr:DoxX family membrane protein [Muribaculaceae bacterium]
MSTRILVLSMRVIVGAVFIMSGITKLIDLWGTVFKIEEYVAVWGIDVPRTVIMMGGLALSTFEFSAGLLLLAGGYRRVGTWGLMACMSFMLPLTLYIW